ncbi:hypothetical protein NL676_039863 [Syzygium grande]|nr:hypothetical protein NL676_039863 [Syzygium grande]
MAEKVEWLNKLRNVIQPSTGGQVKGESGLPLQQSLPNGSLDTMARRPADPEEELRWMSQEFRGYVEAVLNSLGANVPKYTHVPYYMVQMEGTPSIPFWSGGSSNHCK